jgi:pilus assembly protein CpaB
MRARSFVLLVVALVLAGGSAVIAHSWLARQAAQNAANGVKPRAHAQAVLVARGAIARGQLLKPGQLTWQSWPSGALDPAYIREGTQPLSHFAGWVARQPIAPGQPVTLAQIIKPGERGFLAAALRPGRRAVSVRVTATSGISGFVFPGDRVDLLITYPVPAGKSGGYQHKAAETVLRAVRVIAIDQLLTSKGGQAYLAHTATLEVTPKQSEIIALASQMGKLSLSLRSLASVENARRTDSHDNALPVTYTLDSQVSPLLPKLLAEDGKSDESKITILRGAQISTESLAAKPKS